MNKTSKIILGVAIVAILTSLVYATKTLLSCNNDTKIVAKTVSPVKTNSFKEAKWVKVPYTDTEVDLNSLEHTSHVTGWVNKPNLVSVWQKSKRDEHTYAKAFVVYDCGNVTVAVVAMTVFKDNEIIEDSDYIGTLHTYLDFRSNWKGLPPDSQGYETARFVCTK